ncbi:WbqC family protein [Elizabethkingia bruuniana]|uniref:WbqC family protein n=1 Tax=Elizabethkingia bruuniana TaxID=1756149 RepID=A0A7T7UVJ9_9FLAO|nr:WbqC family protein [Elizabethkingia bruuniana]AQX83620.1 hypothetical protein AYC65_00660 [Elizabethkingia bruuniana]KUY22265.1 hypothetical protein ATB97_13535 [Elizabethkingia bruuniana]OPB62476.1 hypothetical protein BAY12_11275 [Elizabethkingia bruuniana]QDZ63611.1 hypothetical protein EVD20_14855 [Elizabethkingia bruuniana]QQN57019.1 WbqC family protein [Elizabethkingia bruuniana]
MKVAISQSNYIPWRGYFDMISSVDYFILYDSVQYTKGDWRNRNVIKTAQGGEWITIPVENYSLTQLIDETCISRIKNKWNIKHLKILKQNYSKSKYFKSVFPWLEDIYLNKINGLSKLTDINEILIKEICDYLNIKTKILRDRDLLIEGDRNSKLINICKQLDANVYLSGPAAKIYVDEELFSRNGIEVEWMNYNGYKEYNQLYGAFLPSVTILDLLFNMGECSKEFFSIKD